MPPNCTQPLWKMLTNDFLNWIPCSHAANGGGPLVVGVFVYSTIAIILFNQSETFYPPLAWTALMTGLIFSYVPGDLAMKILSGVTLMVAAGIIGLWHAWRR